MPALETLNKLLDVKRLRENQALRIMLAQRSAFEEAVTRQDAALQMLTAHQQFAAQQESLMYGELCRRVVSLRDIEDVQGQVRTMRTREFDHRKQLDVAQEDRERQEQQLTEDRVRHLAALRARTKFVDVIDDFAGEARREGERSEEAASEETVESRYRGESPLGDGA